MILQRDGARDTQGSSAQAELAGKKRRFHSKLEKKSIFD
jgi:hypothetical protein